MKEKSFNAPYRAKTKEKGKRSIWIYGFYVRLYDGKGNVSHRIYPGNAESDCGDFYPDWFEVDPDTLCRYSGQDIWDNIKPVYEGDILQYPELRLKYPYSILATVEFGMHYRDTSYGKLPPLDCYGWHTTAKCCIGFDAGQVALRLDKQEVSDEELRSLWDKLPPKTTFPKCWLQNELGEVVMKATVVGNIFDHSHLLTHGVDLGENPLA